MLPINFPWKQKPEEIVAYRFIVLSVSNEFSYFPPVQSHPAICIPTMSQAGYLYQTKIDLYTSQRQCMSHRERFTVWLEFGNSLRACIGFLHLPHFLSTNKTHRHWVDWKMEALIMWVNGVCTRSMVTCWRRIPAFWLVLWTGLRIGVLLEIRPQTARRTKME